MTRRFLHHATHFPATRFAANKRAERTFKELADEVRSLSTKPVHSL